MVFTSARSCEGCSGSRRVCKARVTRRRVGPYISTATSIPEADHIFVGEAETTLPDFVRDFYWACRTRYQAAERPALSLTPVPFFTADLKSYWRCRCNLSRLSLHCEFCDLMRFTVASLEQKNRDTRRLDALLQAGWRGCFM